ncbi:MAG: hypothetical protein P1R74_16355, partial [Sedimenticola sp.]|nr:hypothetical protein [Sedimenticola sp.]
NSGNVKIFQIAVFRYSFAAGAAPTPNLSETSHPPSSAFFTAHEKTRLRGLIQRALRLTLG